MEEALNELQRLGNIPDQLNMIQGLLLLLAILCVMCLICCIILAAGIDKVKKQNAALKEDLKAVQQRLDTIIMNIGKN